MSNGQRVTTQDQETQGKVAGITNETVALGASAEARAPQLLIKSVLPRCICYSDTPCFSSLAVAAALINKNNFKRP